MYRSPHWFLLLLLSVPAALSAAPDGGRLYDTHCAACHGYDGKGGVGVPLSLPAFQKGVSDDYLVRTIRNGRPGRVMPAFLHFSDAEVGAIVRHVRSWSGGAGIRRDGRPVNGDEKRGESLYAAHCATCHGADGGGGAGTGLTFSRPRNLPIIAPALNNPGFLASATDAMIRRTLIQGRAGTPMVSFLKKGLIEQDIDDIVSFVRSYERRPLPDSGRLLEAGEATLIYESPYDLKTTVENVRRAAVGVNFKLIRTQLLEQGLVPEGKENPGQVIVYFCNFGFLNDALAVDPRVGLFLPCRITVLERNGKVYAMSVNPKRLSRLFNNSELNRLCTEMFSMYQAILEEATL